MDNNDFEPVDQEELKRFKIALSHCRTCDHVKMAHKNLSKKSICLEAKLTEKERYVQCICKLFIPKDNLEYLEFIAERKEKRS